MSNTTVKYICLASLLLASALSASATTISVNFTDNGSADSTMSAADVAGLAGTDTRVSNWNNAAVSGTTGSATAFVTNTGLATGAGASWVTDLANWRLPHAVATGDDRMWKGYMDAQASASVTVTSLPFVGTYDVYVYFDGSNGAAWKVANYAIGAISDSGEDSEGADWGFAGEENEAKVYQLPRPGGAGNVIWPVSVPNNDEGNYVVLRGVSGSSFTLAATGTAASGAFRAPINGFQIVGTVPEPSSAFLSVLGAGFALCRRKRWLPASHIARGQTL